MNYYKKIKNELINNEVNKKVKDYSKNRSDLNTYYKVGKLLNDAGKSYGEGIIKKYSDKLTKEFGRKYNYRNLFIMRKFYIIFKDENVNALRSQLSWTHYRELLTLNNINEIKYYIKIAETQNLSYRKLRKRIKSREYERLDDNTKEKLINKEKINAGDLINDPILIRNKFDTDKISEKMLMSFILEDIPSFLKQLGEGFTFIENEYPIKIGDRYNYIDILLYNIYDNCYVVIELKINEIKKEHIGQIETYMNVIDKNLRTVNQGPTIGIIVCKKKNGYLFKYVTNEKIYEREYKLV
jgi:predicted nuclease of restriction endonuclease-like (RecB) superfamily